MAGFELPLKMVQDRLGHASIQMTADRYGHLFPRNELRDISLARGDYYPPFRV